MPDRGNQPMLQAIPIPRVLKSVIRANLDHGFIYLNNPKVGCSTVKNALWTAIAGDHPPDRNRKVHGLEGSPFVNTLVDAERVRKAFVFTFVRNPFQRLVSAYLNKVLAKRDRVWPGFARNHGLNPQDPISFAAFVEIISAIPPEQHDPHWRPQYLNTQYPLVRPNLIADLDAMDAELPRVLARLFPGKAGVLNSTPQRNQGTKARNIWRDHYADTATVARVLALYGPDFAAFGYPTAVAADPAAMKPSLWSDHDHDTLAALVTYWQEPGDDRVRALRRLEAADKQGVLADWTFCQRLRMVQKNKPRVAELIAQYAARIATGPAYLRHVVAGVQSGQMDEAD